MIRLLLYLKHNYKFIWKFIEKCNSLLFNVLYRKAALRNLTTILNSLDLQDYSFRKLEIVDTELIYSLIKSQPQSDLEYFKPHDYERESIEKLFNNKGLLIMGVFRNSNIVGYCFLRFFITGKCFVGRLVDYRNRGKGIGSVMNTVMYNLAWKMRFKCLSTISQNNLLVMNAHKKNNLMHILKELPNNYLLVEFKSSEQH